MERKRYSLPTHVVGLCTVIGLVGLAALKGRDLGVQVQFESQHGLKSNDTEIDLNEEFSYFEVEGNSISEMVDSFMASGPIINELGDRSLAITNYELRITWNMHQANNSCNMSNRVVHVDVHYTLPKWNQYYSSENLYLVEVWEDLFNEISSHERHHGKLAYMCGEELVELVDLYSRDATQCSDVKNDFDELTRKVFYKCELSQKDYDSVYGGTPIPVKDLRPNSGK